MTEENPYLGNVIQQAEFLRVAAHELEPLPQASDVDLRLERAILHSRKGSASAAVCVLLFGGSGVGKSQLFDGLTGQAQASPVSDGIRAFTKRPYIACHPADRPLFADLSAFAPVFVDTPESGLAVIDSPDMDTIDADNRACARALTERADIVVYVTIPDKRANFSIAQEVREWARRKRWFFVLNKIDTVPAEEKTVRDDFVRRLKQLGFDPGADVCFVTNALKPESGEFQRLRELVYSRRSEEQVAALKADAVLAYCRHAVNDDVLDPLRTVRAGLENNLETLDEAVRRNYRELLAEPEVAGLIGRSVRQLTWRALAGRIGGPIGLGLWLQSRWATVPLAYALTRSPLRGFNLWATAIAGFSALQAFFLGTLPLQNLLARVLAGQLEKTNAIRAAARRFLEDRGIGSWLAAKPESEATPDTNANNAYMDWIQSLPEGLCKMFTPALAASDSRNELPLQLNSAILRAAESNAEKIAAGWRVFFANLLPAAILLQAAWQVGYGWIHGTWLPSSFLLNTIFILLLSLIPGWLLIRSAARAQHRKTGDLAEGIVGALSAPDETESLRAAVSRLERFEAQAVSFQALIRSRRKTLQAELAFDRFGAEGEATRIE